MARSCQEGIYFQISPGAAWEVMWSGQGRGSTTKCYYVTHKDFSLLDISSQQFSQTGRAHHWPDIIEDIEVARRGRVSH